MSKCIGVLWKLKPFLTCNLLLLVYNTLILPYFTYCNLIWSNACDIRLNKLHSLQKRAVRIIDKADYLAHTNPIFKNLGLLKFVDIGKLQISIFVYKFLKLELPETFSDYFCLKTSIPSHSTRNSSGLFICFARTNTIFN